MALVPDTETLDPNDSRFNVSEDPSTSVTKKKAIKEVNSSYSQYPKYWLVSQSLRSPAGNPPRTTRQQSFSRSLLPLSLSFSLQLYSQSSLSRRKKMTKRTNKKMTTKRWPPPRIQNPLSIPPWHPGCKQRIWMLWTPTPPTRSVAPFLEVVPLVSDYIHVLSIIIQ